MSATVFDRDPESPTGMGFGEGSRGGGMILSALWLFVPDWIESVQAP
jgi:hypothetical protein